jgi:hypothetical protein
MCTPVSASMFPLGDTVVTCSATDAHHNVASASLTVSVVDRAAPVLSLPAAITANSVNGTSAIVTFTATAIDLVDGAVVPACVPASGFAFPIGTTPVTCTATDAGGNGRSGVFAVTVTMATVVPPTVRCVPGDNPGGHKTDNDEAGFYRVEALPASDGTAIRISLGAFELSNPETIKITRTRPRTAVRLVNTMKGMRHFEVPPEFEIVAIDGAGRHASARCGDGDGRGEDRRER